MGNSNSLKLNLKEEEIRSLQEETGFTLGQINRLYARFNKLDIDDKGYLDREDFLNIHELSINPLGDRIVHAFFSNNTNNQDEEEQLSFQVDLLFEHTKESHDCRSGLCESARILSASESTPEQK